MTKADRRQRAHYKRQLAAWEAGTWSPPRGWQQMVCNRFPDLIEAMRERILGPEEAAAARAAHNDAVRPKVGRIVLVGGKQQIVVKVDHDKRTITYAPNTFVWRALLKLRALVARLFRRENGPQARRA